MTIVDKLHELDQETNCLDPLNVLASNLDSTNEKEYTLWDFCIEFEEFMFP